MDNKHNTVYVHVTTDTPKKQLHPDDRRITGLYEVTLDAGTPADGMANAALDGFHNSIGIKRLDDFEIVVRTAEHPQSDAIEQADTYENGELEVHVSAVTHMGPIPPAVEIATGIDESEQEGSFQNATLQGVVNLFAMSIAANLEVPDEVADNGQEAVGTYVREALSRAAREVPGLSFTVQIGRSREQEENAEDEDEVELDFDPLMVPRQ